MTRAPMVGLSIVAIRIGDHAEITRHVSEDAITGFVDSVGDYNPVHSDPEYAAGTVFEGPVAPGLWTAGLVSAVIGTRLPGPGAIYLSQSLKFLKPVRFGDAVTARVEVLETNAEKNRVRLLTVCTNQHGEEVLTGEAVVKPTRSQVVYSRHDPFETFAGWTLAPWAWMTNSVSICTTLGLASLGLGRRVASGD